MNNFLTCHYHLILNTSKEKNAKVILNRINKEIQFFEKPFKIQPYHKDSTKLEVLGVTTFSELLFENALLEILKYFQHYARDWNISGDYECTINMLTTNLSESGINFINLNIVKNDEK